MKVRKSDLVVIWWGWILFLILLKDSLVCVTGSSIYQVWLGRLGSGSTLLFVVTWLLSERHLKISPVRIRLLLGIMIYFGILSGISMLIHRVNSDCITPYAFCALAVLLAEEFDISQRNKLDDLFEKFLILYIVISLALLPLGAGIWNEDYSGLLSFRWMGINTHPNGMGFLASIYIGLYARKHPVAGGLAWGALILTQSKTALLGLLAWYLILTIRRLKDGGKYGTALLAAGFSGLFLLLLLSGGNIGISFTGRTDIWQYGWDHWSTDLFSIVWGAGENVLTTFPKFYVKQAHNQFLNNLFGAGLVGFICISIWAWFILQWIRRGLRRGERQSAFLGTVILIRCLMESPLYGISLEAIGVIVLFWLAQQADDLDKEFHRTRYSLKERTADEGTSYIEQYFAIRG